MYNGLVSVAGQLATDPKTGEKKLGSIEEQAEQALRNVGEILKAAGSGLDRLMFVVPPSGGGGTWGRVNAELQTSPPPPNLGIGGSPVYTFPSSSM